jgi:hypothetical protein
MLATRKLRFLAVLSNSALAFSIFNTLLTVSLFSIINPAKPVSKL